MPKFNIRITETLEKTVTIDAENVNEALQIADNKYRKSDDEYILDAGNFIDVVFNVVGTEK